ncbi:NusG domain II-containing protein [Clostridium aminobutyricum]|uniref:NusG domain II-containing protein n=1 Tax=Clostridium aminobutyricum TaxID=33953 RepID=A0A939DBB7_CLOAM|nr:NusG domain II-containing protein [Clostridium aminobutyricum]MBN7774606.1 NusG domain II-containing protein [Clostridium aminobutyricum]
MKFFKKTDVFIIIAILVVSGIGWGVYHYFFGQSQAKAEIYSYSKLVKSVDLTAGEDKNFSIPENTKVVFHLYKDGSIAFVESDCPDKVCIHAGKLKTTGQFAACLPNGIVLKIVPANRRSNQDVDIVVGN